MSSLLVISSLFVLLSAIPVSAQPSLRWSVDTVRISQTGCSERFDTVQVQIQNPTSAPASLVDLTGERLWMIDNKSQLLGTEVQPGGSINVNLIFNGGYQNQYMRDGIVLTTDDGSTHTIWLESDIQVSRLRVWPPLRDTFTLDGPIVVGDTHRQVVNVYRVGTVRYNVHDFTTSGDPNFTITWLNLEDSAALNQVFRFAFDYHPTSPGSHTGVATFTGSPCEVPYSYTMIFNAAVSPSVVSWTEREQTITAPICNTPGFDTVELVNASSVPILIDSVKVRADPQSAFEIVASLPAGRVNNFILEPDGSGSTKYIVRFNPSKKWPDGSTKLAVFVSDGTLDTITLRGHAQRSSTRFDSAVVHPGRLKVGESYTLHRSIVNSGDAAFKVSGIESSGYVEVEYDRLAVDTLIEPQSEHSFSLTVRGTKAGIETGRILVFGDYCDLITSMSIEAEYFEELGVEDALRTGRRVRVTSDALALDDLQGELLHYKIYDLLGRLVHSGSTTTGEVDLKHVDERTIIAHIQRTTGEIINLKIQR